MDLSQLNKIKEEVSARLSEALNLSDVEKIKIEVFGKSGSFKNVLSVMKDLSPDERKEFGNKVNVLKTELEALINEKASSLNSGSSNSVSDFYKTLPGKKPDVGHTHIITTAINEIVDIFKPLGFTRVRYPEVDWEYYAFEALNIPKTHPARDEWETFFVDLPEDEKMGKVLITPHTSNGQVQDMLKGDLPIRMLNISRCGRRQIDVSHVPTFFQFEGLVVDKGINITHLKGVLDYFAKNFFGEDRVTRLRPHDFRFTEPSFEVDISCGLCHGKGCRLCKGGWHELGGSGMVHPNVLKYGGIDPEEYTGFAFGWGVERTYMMKSGTKIDDIRHLFGNDLRFLEQF